jgi:hypothetical protein
MSEIFEPSTNEEKKGYNKIIKQDSNSQSTNIESNEKDYYISRIIRHKTKLIKYLIFQLITLLLDLLCSIAYKFLFHNFLNLFSIYLFLFWTIILLCIYKNSYKNFENLNIDSYRAIKRNILITKIIYALMFINIIYTIVKKLVLENNQWINYFYYTASLNEVFLSLLGCVIYVILNLIFPFFVIKKLNRMKRLLNAVGMLKGQEYSVTYTVDVPKLGLNGVERKVEIR